jgi:hypothetical protein
MSRTKTAYGCIWVCGVVVEETSREVEVTGSNHGNRGAWWLATGVPPIQKVFFAVYFRFLSANPENLVLSGDLSARQH